MWNETRDSGLGIPSQRSVRPQFRHPTVIDAGVLTQTRLTVRMREGHDSDLELLMREAYSANIVMSLLGIT